ncbi:hypothetical protein V5E97_05565 [Singulisphaera sp. Ch08]|uniref:Uncharacterized protein n=1 Tax=Singulisphaera sp. Ch08 TaxID=3120278 RepID=A0AAU7CKF8_9BACT
MAIDPTSTSPDTVDPKTGRLRPLTAAQRKARSEALARALDQINEITDETDTDETWREIFHSIDEARPDRPLFEGQY